MLIDEISMLSAELVNRLDLSMQLANNCSAPWGGVPVILFGDFAQLLLWSREELVEPVMTSKILQNIDYQLWYHPLRQTDMNFFPLLNSIRLNRWAENNTMDTLFSRIIDEKHIPHSSVIVTSNRSTADAFNTAKLSTIKGKTHTKYAIDSISGSDPLIANTALKSTYLKYELHLKIGASCMLLHNFSVENGWVNGTMAYITNISEDVITIANKENPEKNSWLQE